MSEARTPPAVALVGEFRRHAERCVPQGEGQQAFNYCAEALEAALAAVPPAPQPHVYSTADACNETASSGICARGTKGCTREHAVPPAEPAPMTQYPMCPWCDKPVLPGTSPFTKAHWPCLGPAEPAPAAERLPTIEEVSGCIDFGEGFSIRQYLNDIRGTDEPLAAPAPAEGPQPEAQDFREWLWANHGCSVGVLYGDDGEMQCGNVGHRPLDFKRDELPEIFRVLRDAAESRLREVEADLEHWKGTAAAEADACNNLNVENAALREALEAKEPTYPRMNQAGRLAWDAGYKAGKREVEAERGKWQPEERGDGMAEFMGGTDRDLPGDAVMWRKTAQAVAQQRDAAESRLREVEAERVAANVRAEGYGNAYVKERTKLEAEVAALQQRLDTLLVEIARYLSPENQNVKNGDVKACIRDMAQIMVTAKDNYGEVKVERDTHERMALEYAERLEAECAQHGKVRAENAALQQRVERLTGLLLRSRLILCKAEAASDAIATSILADVDAAIAAETGP